MSASSNFRQWVGPIEAILTFIGECVLLLGDIARRLFKPPYEVREIIQQMAFVGVASLPIVILTNFFSGAVLSLYLTITFKQYGAESFIGATGGFALTRELCPVLTGMMVAGRAGAAIAAQIGTMSTTEQLDALRMLSVNPTKYLVIPRVVAAVVMMPILALVALYAAGLAGGLVSIANGASFGVLLESLQHYVKPWNLVGGLIKTPIFGLIIAVVACQQGLRTGGGAAGVGRATTNTVVISMVLIYVANFLLAMVLFRG